MSKTGAARRRSKVVRPVCSQCLVCSKYYSIKTIYIHLRDVHSVQAHEQESFTKLAEITEHKCNVCNTYTSSNASLRRHIKNYHEKDLIAPTRCSAKTVECPMCSVHFAKQLDLCVHAAEIHSKEEKFEDYTIKTIKFPDWTSFELYLEGLERTQCSAFTKRSSKRGVTYWQCFHARGKDLAESGATTRIRSSKKLIRSCTAHMRTKIGEDGSVTVTGCFGHLGHKKSMALLPMRAKDELIIVALLKEKLCTKDILLRLREDFYDKNKESHEQPRVYYTTRKDITDIINRHDLRALRVPPVRLSTVNTPKEKKLSRKTTPASEESVKHVDPDTDDIETCMDDGPAFISPQDEGLQQEIISRLRKLGENIMTVANSMSQSELVDYNRQLEAALTPIFNAFEVESDQSTQSPNTSHKEPTNQKLSMKVTTSRTSTAKETEWSGITCPMCLSSSCDCANMNRMSSDEDDYMSETYLQNAQDVRPGISCARDYKRRLQVNSAHDANTDMFRKKPKKIEREKTRLEEGLNKPLDETSKGFGLMAKMGFKPGMSLGKKKDEHDLGSGIKVPIPIQVKSCKTGLGHNTKVANERMDRIRRLMDDMKDRARRNDELIDDYRRRKKEERTKKEMTVDIVKSRKVCCELDLRSKLEFPEQGWFWRSYKVIERSDDAVEGTSEENVDERYTYSNGNEAPPEERYDDMSYDMLLERLLTITDYLRREHRYCVWCGCQYETEETILAQCPGGTRTEHDD